MRFQPQVGAATSVVWLLLSRYRVPPCDTAGARGEGILPFGLSGKSARRTWGALLNNNYLALAPWLRTGRERREG